MADKLDPALEQRIGGIVEEALVRLISRPDSPDLQGLRAVVLEEIDRIASRPDGAHGPLRLPDVERTQRMVDDAILRIVSRPDGASGEFRVPDIERTERMVESAIGSRVARGKASDAEATDEQARVPDIERTRELAREVVEAWHAERPRWWDVRKRLESGLIGGGIATVLILALVDYASDDLSLVRDGIHLVAGTDQMVQTSLTKTFENWAENTEAVKPIKSAFSTGLESMVRSDTPELSKLILKTLKSEPILMFQGEASFGEPNRFVSFSEGCFGMVRHLWKTPELLPAEYHRPELGQDERAEQLRQKDWDVLLKACRSTGDVLIGETLSVPFWARFHPDPATRGRGDHVQILLRVQRQRIPEETNGEPLEHPYPNSLRDLRIEYQPATDERRRPGIDVIDLSDDLQHRQGGFYIGNISDKISRSITPPPGNRHAAFELMHSLVISSPELPEGKNYDDFCSAELDRPEPHAVCLKEIVLIQAIVMVNTGDRS